MSDAQFREQIDSIVALTRNMLEACREGAWERFHDLEPRRRDEIMALFATSPQADDAEYAASAIKSVIDLDERIIGICEEEKRACAEQLATIRRGRHVHDAYSGRRQGAGHP